MPSFGPLLERIDVGSTDPTSAYVRAMTSACPFIEPALGADGVFACEIRPDCRAESDLHPRLFEQLVPLIERFRDCRRALPERRRRLLLSHTVIIRLPESFDAAAVRLLKWPNLLSWSLKQLYTPTEIVLGFVRKGVLEKSAAQVDIPVAPFYAVVIRSRVVSSDGRFFPGNAAMLQAMISADDNGQDVHAAMFDDAPDIRDPQALRDGDYYERVLQHWKRTLAGR